MSEKCGVPLAWRRQDHLMGNKRPIPRDWMTDACYFSEFIDGVNKVRRLKIGFFEVEVKGSAREFARQVLSFTGSLEIARKICGTNGAGPDELGEMLNALGVDEPVREKVTVVMNRNGNGNGK